jgi:lipopolysaccharide transport system permease protein
LQRLAFVTYRALAELRAESARTYLGVAWWVLEPILFMSVFYALFASGLRLGPDDFMPFVLTGIIPWKWFQSSVSTSAGALVKNANLIAEVSFPKHLLVSVALVSTTIKYLIVLGLLLLALQLIGYPAQLAWWTLALIVTTQFTLIFGCSCIAASILPFFPDLRFIIDNGLLMLFFLSGVFFDISARPQEAQEVLYLNPVARLLSEYRAVLLSGQTPNPEQLSIVAVAGLSLSIIGLGLLKMWDKQYARISP